MKMVTALSFVRFFVLFFLLALNGCNLNSSSNVAPLPSAEVAFFHGSPNNLDMTVYLDDAPLSGTFAYKTYSGYIQTNNLGIRKVKFISVASAATLIDTTFNFVQNKAYTIAVVNKPSGKPQAIIIEDGVNLVNQADTPIRFIHLSPDTPAVDVKFINVGTTLVTGQTYMQASQFQEFAVNNYSAEIRRSSDNKLLLTVGLPLTNAAIFQTIYFVGYSNPPGGSLNSLSARVTN